MVFVSHKETLETVLTVFYQLLGIAP